jgi:hypothetical protein
MADTPVVVKLCTVLAHLPHTGVQAEDQAHSVQPQSAALWWNLCFLGGWGGARGKEAQLSAAHGSPVSQERRHTWLCLGVHGTAEP